MSKMTSLERIKRLLSVLPWIESQNGPYIDEVVARFDYPKPFRDTSRARLAFW